jgi:hypothetical protein
VKQPGIVRLALSPSINDRDEAGHQRHGSGALALERIHEQFASAATGQDGSLQPQPPTGHPDLIPGLQTSPLAPTQPPKPSTRTSSGFMVITKASAESEAGVLPATEEFDTMGKFIEELVDAGVLLAAEGLQSSAKGARIYFDGDKKTVVDGPFTETKELIAGFWLVEMKSLEECVEWFKRCPIQPPGVGAQTNIEIRRVFEAEDFGENFTAEQQEAVDKRRAKVARNN